MLSRAPMMKKSIGVLGRDSNPRPPAYLCRRLNQLHHRACRWRVADLNPVPQWVPQQLGMILLALGIVNLNWEFLALPDVNF